MVGNLSFMGEVNMNVKREAFRDGFLQGLGNVGQVYEPIVGGVNVVKESRRPVIFTTIPSRKALIYRSYLRQRSANWRGTC